MFQQRTISIAIACDFDIAYNFLCAPENFPTWASGLGTSLIETDGIWIAQTPHGPAKVRFTDKNAFGVLDHYVMTPEGEEIYMPMRLIANGTGCELLLTLFRLPGVSDQQFDEDEQWVLRDLSTLKRLLESKT
jgi:hypothetical protein